MKQTISLPDNYLNLLESFRNEFTEPSLQYFIEIIKGILLSPRKSVVRFFMLGDRLKHFTDYHRFLNKYIWSAVDLSSRMLTMLITAFGVKKLILALDDTLIPKYGKKIFGRGIHFDHAAKENLAQYIKGHNWVIIGFLQHMTMLSKWVCFPFAARLFIPEKNVAKGEKFLTKIDIAIEMLREIKQNIILPIVLVADALYAKEKLIKECIVQKITLISRLRSDAALYRPVSQIKKKPRGRPAHKGKRLPSIGTLSKESNRFIKKDIKLYGELKTVRYREVLAYWKPAGTVIKVVIVWYPQKRKEVNAAFFTIDLDMAPEQLLQMVAARWSLENAFKDMKEHLGFGKWQCRKEDAVKRSVPLTCIAYSSLFLWSAQQVEKNAPTLWDVAPWDKYKDTVALSDLLYQLKSQCITRSILEVLETERISKIKFNEIHEILRAAA
jgi:SRSO17 transposase